MEYWFSKDISHSNFIANPAGEARQCCRSCISFLTGAAKALEKGGDSGTSGDHRPGGSKTDWHV